MIVETVQYYAVGALVGALLYVIAHNEFFGALNRSSATPAAVKPLKEQMVWPRDVAGVAALFFLLAALIAGLFGVSEGAKSALLLGMVALGANMGLCGVFDSLFPASIKIGLRR